VPKPVARPRPIPAPERGGHAVAPAPATTGGSGILTATRAKVLLAGAVAVVLAITIVILSLPGHDHDQSGGSATGGPNPAKGVLHGLRGPVRSMTFSPDGRAIAAVGADDAVHVWNTATGVSGMPIGHTDGQSHLALGPDGKVLAVSQGDTVRLWTVATGKLKATITGDGAGYSLAFSPDGETLALANTLAAEKSYTNRIRLWSTTTGRDAGTLPGHTNGIEVLAFSRDGKLLASGGSGPNPVRVWTVASRKTKATLKTDVGTFAGALAFSDDGRTLVSLRGHTVQVWDVGSAQVTATFTKGTEEVRAVGFGPGRTFLAAGSSDPVVLWSAPAGQATTSFSFGGPTSAVGFSPDTTTLAVGGQDGSIRLWDIPA
jgi:WD40 repeat protein